MSSESIDNGQMHRCPRPGEQPRVAEDLDQRVACQTEELAAATLDETVLNDQSLAAINLKAYEEDAALAARPAIEISRFFEDTGYPRQTRNPSRVPSRARSGFCTFNSPKPQPYARGHLRFQSEFRSTISRSNDDRQRRCSTCHSRDFAIDQDDGSVIHEISAALIAAFLPRIAAKYRVSKLIAHTRKLEAVLDSCVPSFHVRRSQAN